MNAVELYAKPSADYEAKLAHARAVLISAAAEHGPRIVQATSLGAEDMVLTHLIASERLPIAIADCAGVLSAALIVSLWQLYATVGVIVAIGAGAASPGVAAVVVTRWFESRRGLALGIVGGAMASGQLLVIPLAMGLTMRWGWRRPSTNVRSGPVAKSCRVARGKLRVARVCASRLRMAAGVARKRMREDPT